MTDATADVPPHLDDLDCPPLGGGVVDCSQVIARLFHFLDGELAPERMARVQAHLDRCMPCLEAFDFHAELRLVVQNGCREVVPPAFLERLAAALDACAAEVDQNSR